MKLATFMDNEGRARLGAVDLDSGSLLDLEQAAGRWCPDSAAAFRSMQSLIDAGEGALDEARALLDRSSKAQAPTRPLASTRLLAPLPRPLQIRCFSTYEQHLLQSRNQVSKMRWESSGRSGLPPSDILRLDERFYTQPAFYFTNRFNVAGPRAVVQWPHYSDLLDYELEIAAVIGRRVCNAGVDEARRSIFGFTLFNDFSAREQVLKDMALNMGPTKGKSFNTANAMGPWIVTADEVPDVQRLKAELRINGEVQVGGSTAGMLFGFEQMIEYASRDEDLHPGEVLTGGTLGGFSGLEAGRWLQAGDAVECAVEGLGTLQNFIGIRNTVQPRRPVAEAAVAHFSQEFRSF